MEKWKKYFWNKFYIYTVTPHKLWILKCNFPFVNQNKFHAQTMRRLLLGCLFWFSHEMHVLVGGRWLTKFYSSFLQSCIISLILHFSFKSNCLFSCILYIQQHWKNHMIQWQIPYAFSNNHNSKISKSRKHITTQVTSEKKWIFGYQRRKIAVHTSKVNFTININSARIILSCTWSQS